jgi:8-oxo-dGTP pyrophosphatase MutT (NUDIX family)
MASNARSVARALPPVSGKGLPGNAGPSASPQGLGNGYLGNFSPMANSLNSNDGSWTNAYRAYLPRPADDFANGAFGPFSPTLPVPVDAPEQDSDFVDPRLWQYEVGWNLPVGQPGTEGIKMADFSTLRTLADLYSVARACIQLRKAEIRGLAWDITPTKEAAKAMRGSEGKMREFGKRRAQALKFFRHPDPDYFSWGTFMDALLEEVFVFDALSLLFRNKWAKGQGRGLLGSDLDCISLINGPTIRPLVSMHGEKPRPPAPAYQQYLYGVPRCDLMTVITQRDLDYGNLSGAEYNKFRSDQLLYLPMVPKRWTPYGFPPIERALVPVMAGLQKQGYQLDFFREGTVPAVYISPGGVNSDLTPNQIRELQDALNAVAGDTAYKHKIIVLPADSKVMPQKPTEIADQFDEIVMNQVCMAFDVQPMELGISPKVSTTQSPGAANQMAKASQGTHQRKATKPLLMYLADIFNMVLWDVAGQEDMQFVFEGLEEDEDEETQTNLLVTQIGAGLSSIDEGREALGKQPWGLPETSDPGWATMQGFVPLGQLTAQGMVAPGQQPNAIAPATAQQPGQQNQQQGKPAAGGTPAHAAAQGGQQGTTGATPANPSAAPAKAPAKAPAQQSKPQGKGALLAKSEDRRAAHVAGTAADAAGALHKVVSRFHAGEIPAAAALQAAVDTLGAGYRTVMDAASQHAVDDHGGVVQDFTGQAATMAEQQREFMMGVLKKAAEAQALTWLTARLDLYARSLNTAYNKAFGSTVKANHPSYQVIWRLGASEHCKLCVARDGKSYTFDSLPGWPGDGGFGGGGALCLGGPNCHCSLEYVEAGAPSVFGENTQLPEATAYYQQQLQTIMGNRAQAAQTRTDFLDTLPAGAAARALTRDQIRELLADEANAAVRATGGYPGVSVEPADIPAIDVFDLTPEYAKAQQAELEALARHVRKGRLISTWQPRHIDNPLLARIAEYMAKGLDVETAIDVARQMRRVDLGGQEYWAANNEWTDPAGGGGQVLAPHDADDIFHSKGAGDPHDPNPVDAAHVYHQLLRNYPPKAIGWVNGARWIGPVEVPLDRIDRDDVDSWAASHQPERVKHFAKLLRKGKPVSAGVSVQEPGESKIKVVDGHHRYLASVKAGKPFLTYIGFVDSDGGPWDQTHVYQFHQGSDPQNKAATMTKEQAHYRTGTPTRHCGNCSMFRLRAPDFETGACTLVKGIISQGAVCDHWDAVQSSKSARPVAAGLVVRAADTGRVLMLQRDYDDEDPAAGMWEFPGGCLEDGEDSLAAARREWAEETGLPVPTGEPQGYWESYNGVYQGYVLTVPSEDALPILGERGQVNNPDDPDGDHVEALAWWDPETLRGNPAIREELHADMNAVLHAIAA